MHALKRTTKPTVYFLFLLTVMFLILNIEKNYENDLLLLLLNTAFIGLIPVVVSIFSTRAYIQNGIVSALLMSCGMFIFGLGSIIR